ncbi:MAG: branched-chain amino acid transport system ATP-binding protein [Candidatus Eremiobacteraeota bacterium]|jgi:branched-chain amino acid transport system ATP-binding protein|nr:branched-chain amino acid transport system ATP-binding protein [Candidatus Eremiobacteraeota bacterium]
MADAVLAVRGLRKAFGALVVSDDLDLDVRAGECHALIGPNGAGKTTLLAQLAGEVAPDRGTIAFGDRDVTRLSSDARARLGIARSFQITTIVDDFTAEDNVALAVQARNATAMRFWKSAFRDAALREPARAALARVGLSARAGVRASDLAHGEQRLLELAIALAQEPAVMLLDEPMAGLGHDESRAMIELLRGIKGTVAMLLIEHDMEAVAQLADRVTVLVSGRVIATGTYDAIRDDARVREAYLGEDA